MFCDDPHTSFESLCRELPDFRHLLSQMYKLVLGTCSITVPYYIRKWEKELGLELNNPQIQRIIKLTHTSYIISRTQESSYKRLNRLYKTSSQLAGYFLPVVTAAGGNVHSSTIGGTVPRFRHFGKLFTHG